MTNSLVNGEIGATINVSDRGLQYGDGLFETMVVRNGTLQLWNEHYQRLALGCERLSIKVPDITLLEQEISLLSKNQKKCIIKIIITRGEGQRGYRFPEQQNPTRILTSHPYPNYPDSYKKEGVSVRYCNTTLSENEKLAGIKHLNRLEQVLARNEWHSDEFQEGLMLTSQGHVVDGTMSNIFAVKDNMIFTPSVSLCGVAGVMRRTIINLSKKLDFPVYEKVFNKSELEAADELFLTNSVYGIWPVRVIAKTRFTKVGDVTKQLQEELKKSGW